MLDERAWSGATFHPWESPMPGASPEPSWRRACVELTEVRPRARLDSRW